MTVHLVREELRASGLVGTVAMEAYDDPAGRLDRRLVEDARRRFTDLCTKRLGFAHDMRIDGTGTLEDVRAGLRRFLDYRATRKILYWTGHGYDVGGYGYFLGCRDSFPAGDLDRHRAMRFTDLLQQCADERDTEFLVVVDACQSQSTLGTARPLVEAYGHAAEGTPRERGLVVAATAGAGHKVDEGRWVDWLEQALSDERLELAGMVRPFASTALYLSLPDLLEAVDTKAKEAGLADPEQRPRAAVVRPVDTRFLHNPYFSEENKVFRTAARPPGHLPWLRPAHFDQVADTTTRDRFRGRQWSLSRLVTWLEATTGGMLVVTGAAGTGKTALLGRLALLSVPEICESLRPVPPPQTRPRPGSVHAAVSCGGESLHSLAAAVLEVLRPLGARLPEAGVTPEQCVERVAALVREAGALNLLVDSLDEAMPGQAHEMARRLLNPLSHCPGVKLVVATRAHPRQLTDDLPRESLLDALDRTAPDLHVARDDDTEQDIAGLVATVLDGYEGSPYAGPANDGVRLETARQVAAHCGRRFLVARLVARALAREPECLSGRQLADFVGAGGAELRARMADELEVLDPSGRYGAAALLLPLALAQGRGLSDLDLWFRMAGALLRRGTAKPSRESLDTVLSKVTDVLVTVEHRSGRPPMYRLGHASYGVALLARARLEPAAAHRQLYEELASGDWDAADAYTLAHLGAHAAQATAGSAQDDEPDPLTELFDDHRFLVRTDPDVMLPLAGSAAATCDGAALYRRVGGEFRRHTDLVLRRAILRAAAHAGHPDSLRRIDDLPEFRELRWDEVWTDTPPDPPEVALPGPLGGARAISWTAADGGTVAVAGRGEITVRAADTGAHLLTRRTAGSDHGQRAVLTELREADSRTGRLVAANDGSSLHLWSGVDRLPRTTFHWGGTLAGLTAGRIADDLLVVAADGRRVWAWRWPAREGVTAEARATLLAVPASRVALLGLRDRGFLLTAGTTVTLHELHGKLSGDEDWVRKTWDLGTLQAPAYAATALADGPDSGLLAVVDGEEARIWRLSAPGYAAAPRLTPEFVAPSASRDAALGFHGDRPLVALREDDGGTVRITGVTDSTFRCSFALGSPHDGMAFDPRRSGRLAVGDGDTVRLLDVPAAVRACHEVRRRQHDERPVVRLTAAEPGAPSLLARVWGHEVLVTRQHAREGRTGPEAVLRHDRGRRITAVAGLRHDGGWTVAVATGRRIHVWRLADDLGVCEPDGRIDLGGDDGDHAEGLGLVDTPDGPQLFVPDGRRVRRYAPVGPPAAWQCTGEATVPGAVKVRAVHAHTAEGRTWALADCGDALLLWESTGRGLEPAGRHRAAPDRPAGAVLGAHLVAGEPLPLVAWGQGSMVHLAECEDGEWTTTAFPHAHGTPAALAFSGRTRRPLLLVLGGGRTVSVRDVRREAWLDELAVPYRGMDVEAADAAYDRGDGITLALQGRVRCDQIRLPEPLITSALRSSAR
ncbi:ATP-binding protein [Streptomyces sp. ISL-100]|uniref:ATP-binding protein n=1 Tax=Streptomyces sp. ISL-100 TaxID=2819173 RepID=UPI001BE71666|nr:ATP-binding protein [Streptomyces sp. ISL-100]MBT2401451.1 ATP-binding protein [Streptomyces sp. ISL-100]